MLRAWNLKPAMSRGVGQPTYRRPVAPRADERRRQVLRVAEQMFLSDGYGGVTVRAVAEATGT